MYGGELHLYVEANRIGFEVLNRLLKIRRYNKLGQLCPYKLLLTGIKGSCSPRASTPRQTTPGTAGTHSLKRQYR